MFPVARKIHLAFIGIVLPLAWFAYYTSVSHRSVCDTLPRTASEWPSVTGQRVPKEYVEDLPICSAIVRGDMAGRKARLLGSWALGLGSRGRLSEDFYLNAMKDCNAYVEDRGFFTAPLSVEERDFPIAYSMVIHADVEMFERLLRAVYHPQNVYCVHVDTKSPEGFLEAVRAIVSCFPNVFVASKLERVVYASWTRVQADLNCMKDLVESPVLWRYLLNTCGTDLPIRTNAEMVQALKLLNGKNSLESGDVRDGKEDRWQNRWHEVAGAILDTGIRKSPPPIEPVFIGSAYFAVTRDFVTHVLDNEEVRRFMEWCEDTYSPDEHLWATLNRMSSVPGSLPAHWKYHTSDMNSIARLAHWQHHAGDVTRGAAYPPCTSRIRRDLCVYGAGDLQWLFQQHHLIANKFDPEVDDVAIRCVESIVRFKALHYSQNLMAVKNA